MGKRLLIRDEPAKIKGPNQPSESRLKFISLTISGTLNNLFITIRAIIDKIMQAFKVMIRDFSCS